MIQETISNAVDKARDVARDGSTAASETFQSAANTTRVGFLDVLKTVTGTVAAVRSLGVGDMLGWVGLERKRGPFMSVGAFGAGLAVGAGLGMLFAPAAGSETQRKIGKFVRDLVTNEKKELENAAADMKQKADDVAHKVTDKVDELKSKAGDKVEAAKDGLNGNYKNGKREQGLDV